MIRFTVLLFLILSGCDYFKGKNFESALKQKNCDQAKSILLNMLKENPSNFKPKYNLIYSYVCAGDLPSALKQVDVLLKEEKKYAFELYFLKGYLNGEIEELDEALASYQKALEIHADTRVKQNMELLLKQQGGGKSGKKQKGKGKKQEDSESDKNSDGSDSDSEKENKDPKSSKQKDQDPKDGNSKKMTQKQIEKIMNEIDGDEKKIRSQGLKIKDKKGSGSSGKNW
jgi:tetratricopeptide (TPR) repeat protein